MVQNFDDLLAAEVIGAVVAYQDETNGIAVSWFGDGSERLIQVSGDDSTLAAWLDR